MHWNGTRIVTLLWEGEGDFAISELLKDIRPVIGVYFQCLREQTEVS
jgi:hypothetical protein